MVFGGGGKVGLYGRGKAENRAKVGSGESRIAWGCGGYQGSGGYGHPDRQGILRSSPEKLLIK